MIYYGKTLSSSGPKLTAVQYTTTVFGVEFPEQAAIRIAAQIIEKD